VRYLDGVKNIMMEMHSHFLDTSRQDARTTHTHRKVLLDYLFEYFETILMDVPNSTVVLLLSTCCRS
jgi:hypothetical protein